MINKILNKSTHDELLSADEITTLYKVSLFSPDAASILAASRRKSVLACGNKAEVHAQVGLNIAPCPRNCLFCAFAACNEVFGESTELSIDEVVQKAKLFESDCANAIFLMATAQYPFEKFFDFSKEVRRQLKPETVMIANVGDFNQKQAYQLKDCGFSGIYHALRLGEGRDTSIKPEKRLKTVEYAREVGLSIGTCVEPVGNEHSIEELVEKTIVTREMQPTYSGSARRIPIPGTKLAKHGTVSEARMAHILAVVRLALGTDTPGNCTHEPSVIGAAAGANLFWAESGSNPRDTEADTEGKRGMTVQDCRRLLQEAEWEVLDGPSRFYAN